MRNLGLGSTGKMAHRLGKFVTCSTYLGIAMAVISLLIVVLLVSLNVVLRFFFNEPLAFVYDYSTYLFIVAVYMGFAYATRTGAHISIDFVVRRLQRRVRDGLDALTSLVALGLMSMYLWFAWDIFRASVVVGKRAMTISATPEWIPHSVLVIGLAFLIMELIAHIARKSRDFLKGG